MKTTPMSDAPREAHFMGDDDHGHAVARQIAHDFQHFVDHFRVQGRGRLVEEHDLGPHGERAGNGDALLLAAGKIRRIDSALSGMPTRSSNSACDFFRFRGG